MRKIIPTVFSKNKKDFKEKFDKLIGISRELQIDFMDGNFVRAKGISLSIIPNLKNKKINFEAHLMVEQPGKWINNLKKKGFKKVILHIECKNDIKRVLDKIHKDKMEAWIALNPSTSLKKIEEFLGQIDGVLFMGVNPGKENQKFIPRVLEKIKKLRKRNNKIKIQVDGGVNLKNIGTLKKIGVNIVNSGSFVSQNENPKGALKELKKAFR